MKSKMGCSTGGSVNLGGGVKAPRYGENNKVLDMAKGKTTGVVKMDGPSGDAAKARLDRPMRKHGGAAKKKG